jgi:hypothetical protein
MAERTGCPVFSNLWSYVLDEGLILFISALFLRQSRRCSQLILRQGLLVILEAQLPSIADGTSSMSKYTILDMYYIELSLSSILCSVML